jgi:aminoglycoside 3-N-acetyltransferase
MSEHAAIAKTDHPVTVATLTRDLEALGIHTGMTLIVHTSLSALGWVCGGPSAVIEALRDAVGEGGNLIMPAQSGDLSDPAHWRNPPVPEAWWPIIRDTMPAFRPELTPTRGMGAVAELFRTYPGVQRSDHPTASFAALGPHAAAITREQLLEDPLGLRSPLAKLYELDASVLLLGVGHSSNTTLHFAERSALGDEQARIQTGAPLTVAGVRQWVSFSEPDLDSDDFAEAGAAFERETAHVALGRVGRTEARLMPVRVLVDDATVWFRAHRLRR